ncbi:MAG: transketolase C-terminal domain-containing protein [Desulfatirhabdiaceae bacterium]
MIFPVDLSRYHPLSFDMDLHSPDPDQLRQLECNIGLVRDSIVFFTAFANKKGLGGHTGGAYDIVPELLILDGLMKGDTTVFPVCFDEAGHRVAAQYILAALNGFIPVTDLLHYREFDKDLYGHPERNDKKGVFFSSGRLGHLWSYVNGIAEAHPDRAVILFGSDGSQQEGGDAEAARYAVARHLSVKLMIDDNDVTIAGHPSQYMKGFDVEKTLKGHGLCVDAGDGENITVLFSRIQTALKQSGPVALINRRKMAPDVDGIEGSPKGHDVISVPDAISYLRRKGWTEAADMLAEKPVKTTIPIYLGSTPEMAKNRDDFGKYVCEIIQTLKNPKSQILVVDSDLEGSCGLHHIRKAFPDIYVHGGIMERNNFSVAAGFGASPGRQGVFGTFSAFLEMVVSEITMARLNHANVLAHFSHAGVDDMADNTCHFGINIFFSDNGLLENDNTRLYFPADTRQLKAVLQAIFHDSGLRFIFSTRSATPHILTETGKLFFDESYRFIPGKDDLIRSGDAGYIVSYGEMLYRCLDVVENLKTRGIHVGLVNKATLNMTDEDMLIKIGKSPAVLVVETQNDKSGLGSRMGTWLLEKGLHCRYSVMGTRRPGKGGLAEQIPYQGLGVQDIEKCLIKLIKLIKN